MKCIQVFGNSNPAGTEIYPGYYALAACLILNMTVEESIAKIIYGKEASPEHRPQKKPSKRNDIIEAYKSGQRDYKVLAKRFGCTVGYVWKALTLKGVVEKNYYYEKTSRVMERNPAIEVKALAAETGMGLRTAYRMMMRYYKEHNIGAW